MKKQITLLASALLISAGVHAQSFRWAAQAGGNDYDAGEDVAVDAANNVYMVGIFNQTADFDPGAGTYTMTSAGAQDVYVMKLDSNKNFKWGVRVGGTQQDFAYSIAVNGNSVYLCGNFRGTVDFDPGPGVNNLVSAGGSDVFVLKLDTASNFIWAQQLGGTGNDLAENLTIDNAGNILIAGEFQSTVDFDPGAGTQYITSSGSADAYVLKLDSNGGYIWAGRFGNSPGQFAYSIATDAANAVYVTGEFYGTTDFDPGATVHNMTASGFNANIYVLKWSAAGDFIWSANMGNSSGGDCGYAVETDAAGNPVITGSYYGTVDFNPGSGVYNLTASGSSGDVFVLKLTSSSGAFMFAKSIGGTTLDQAYGLALNTAGDIYVTGFYSTTADFDPDASGVYNLTASGPADAFVLELDASGNFMWAYGFGGTDMDFSRGIITYGSDVYTCGIFAYTPDFDPGLPVYNITSFSYSTDAFLLKLRFCSPLMTSVNYDLCPGDSMFAGGSYQHNPGVYYDYFIAAGGCDSIVTTTVQYTYAVNLGNDIIICAGQSALLNSNVAGAVYLWSTGDTTQTVSVNTAANYWVRVTKIGCVQQDTILVTVNVCSGIDAATEQENAFTFFPNPASNFTVIESADKIKEITLTDITGKVLLNKNYDDGRNSIQFSVLPFTNGTYFLQMKTNNEVRTVKVLVQH